MFAYPFSKTASEEKPRLPQPLQKFFDGEELTEEERDRAVEILRFKNTYRSVGWLFLFEGLRLFLVRECYQDGNSEYTWTPYYAFSKNQVVKHFIEQREEVMPELVGIDIIDATDYDGILLED